MKKSILERFVVVCMVVVLAGWSWAAAGEGCCPKKQECNKEQKQCDKEKKGECKKEAKQDGECERAKTCPKK